MYFPFAKMKQKQRQQPQKYMYNIQDDKYIIHTDIFLLYLPPFPPFHGLNKLIC